jgi:hypothetical protein
VQLLLAYPPQGGAELFNNVRVVEGSERVNTNNLNFTQFTEPVDKPWLPFYVTSDEFFEILRVAYEDSYGKDTGVWHPEDIYVNVSTVLETLTNTLSNMSRIRSGKPLRGIKES